MATVCTLVIPVREKSVWLARKKLKVGAGRYNGWGGVLEEKDCNSHMACACREFREESGATIYMANLDYRAHVDFYRAGEHRFACHVYFVSEWICNMEEGEEMGLPRKFPIDALPYADMMPADREWLPRALSAEPKVTPPFHAKVFYNKENTALERPVEFGPIMR